MRNLTFILISLLLFTSCKKDLHSLSGDTAMQLDKTTAYLKSQLSAADFSSLDFAKPDLTILDSGQILLWRVPFAGKSIATDFVLVQAGADGVCTAGRIIHLENGLGNGFVYNDSVSIQSLGRQSILQSGIENGFITALHPSVIRQVSVNSLVSVDVVPASAGADVLPEVVIVGYINSTGTPPTLASYMSLLTLMASSPNGGSGATGVGGSGGGGGSGSAPGTTTSPVGGGSVNIYTPLAPNGGGSATLSPSLLTKPIEVEAEYTTNEPAIDITAYFKCFDNVPSAGATFTIKLCADLPVNSNPAYVTLGSSSGHAFITLTKTNGSLSVTQSYGFYPTQSISLLNPFGNVIGGIKDNGGHEINASIVMTINESQFTSIKTNSIAWSTKSYSLAGYNCTNYALNVFNSMNSIPLVIDPLTVYLPNSGNTYNPGAPPQTVNIPDSPQALFVKLQRLKSSGSSAAGNITIDQTHNTISPISYGPCY